MANRSRYNGSLIISGELYQKLRHYMTPDKAWDLLLRHKIEEIGRLDDLLEIVMDLGRVPAARYVDGEYLLNSHEISTAEIDGVVASIGDFDDDNRTGIKEHIREALFETVPGGSRWRYVWGSTLTFTLMIQFITGIFLWMGYSASSGDAWESVNYIQNEMTGGWLLRGIHHWTAQLMPVLLLLHLMQVVIDGAYKAPREVNYWFGVLLLLLVLALSLTGYLLPWDQKGFWATRVATNLMNLVPFAGPEMQKLVVGGTEYGHHTLTRFFALHAGVLPGLLVLLIVGHIYLFRRHGITPAEPARG